MIAVADDGDNSIIVVPGANGHVRPVDVELGVQRVAPSVMLMQLEIPLATVKAAAGLGRRFGARVLLDPAPAPASYVPDLTAEVDIILPNEGELGELTGLPIGGVDDAIRAAEKLRGRDRITIVVKRGAQGALIVDDDGPRLIPAPVVDVVDTTGAGDCFDGALAAGLLEGWSLDKSVRFATHAAALACTRIGAQSAQPTRTEVRALLNVG
jgi:ribokinase